MQQQQQRMRFACFDDDSISDSGKIAFPLDNDDDDVQRNPII